MTETTHRGVRWRRDDAGRVSFYDADAGEWVQWAPGVDAPPLPPKWQLLGVPTKVARPAWRSPWRVVPIVLVVGAVLVAVFQSISPSPDNSAKEARESAALLGKCLPRNGSHGFSAGAVPCDSPKAAVKVVAVVPTAPPTACPQGTTGVILGIALSGVAHPHQLCIAPVGPAG